MRSGGRTPEELECMLEDAFIMHDADALTALFHERAVVTGGGPCEARGQDEIASAVADMWERHASFVAEVRRVVQSGNTALSFGRGTHVLNRSRSGLWRYVISILEPVKNEGGGEEHA